MENSTLEQTVTPNTDLKTMVVNYIGDYMNAEELVTVDMAVEVFAREFPEFLLAVAEENFLRGYEQALSDIAAIETDA